MKTQKQFLLLLITFSFLSGCRSTEDRREVDYVAVYFQQYEYNEDKDGQPIFGDKLVSEEGRLFRRGYHLRYDDDQIKNIHGKFNGGYYYRSSFYFTLDDRNVSNSFAEQGTKEVILDKGRTFYFYCI